MKTHHSATAMIATRTAPSPIGEITLVKLSSRQGGWVELSSLGAGIVSLVVPDREGRLRDVALGYASPADYLSDGPCMGKTPGRYANRIARGLFPLDGKRYVLPVNNGPNHLHGGPEGFQNLLWQASLLDGEIPGVIFSLHSPDGQMGYPGGLEVEVCYRWDGSALSIHYSATCDSPTIVNLTNHAYFNLDGHDSGSVLDQELFVNAHSYLPTDDTLIPLGAVAPVEGTPMDFREPVALGRRIHEPFDALRYGKGYDSSWVIHNPDQEPLSLAARLYSPASGIRLSVSTNQPALQVYTGNWLAGSPLNKSGRPYNDYDGVALECQNYPDAPNNADAPSPVLRPGERYERDIVFAFDTCKARS